MVMVAMDDYGDDDDDNSKNAGFEGSAHTAKFVISCFTFKIDFVFVRAGGRAQGSPRDRYLAYAPPPHSGLMRMLTINRATHVPKGSFPQIISTLKTRGPRKVFLKNPPGAGPEKPPSY